MTLLQIVKKVARVVVAVIFTSGAVCFGYQISATLWGGLAALVCWDLELLRRCVVFWEPSRAPLLILVRCASWITGALFGVLLIEYRAAHADKE
jgi:hypothetical protein